MNKTYCTTTPDAAEKTPAAWSQTELLQRAGGLVRETLAGSPTPVWRAHREDMLQTAVVAFLEQADRPIGYAYAAARTALKNYRWVHIRGLNSGWKSLACIERGYTVLDVAEDRDSADNPETVLDRLLAHTWDSVPRPVEWTVQRRLAPKGLTQEETLRRVLYILAGMSGNFYPEQLYRAALVITLLGRGYTWEHVEARTGLGYEQLFDIYWGWRKRHLNPYLQLTPLHREVVKLRGQVRISYFEEIDETLLNTAVRKMVIFAHGVYTITYKRRKRGPGGGHMEASLQKGRLVNGRNVVRAVHLGAVGELSKERLYAASLEVERKLAAMGAAEGAAVARPLPALMAVAGD